MYRLILLFRSILLLFIMSSCSVGSNLNKNDNNSLVSLQLLDGWDIYDGGGYRYGPSIIIDSAEVIHAWFASPGSVYGRDQVHFEESSLERPIPIGRDTVVAQRFQSDKAFFGVAVRCPSWNSTTSGLSMSLYLWNESYKKSLEVEPILSVRFSNYLDNQNIILHSDKKFDAGQYLWVLNDATGTAGVWARTQSAHGVIAYLNGKKVSYAYESFLMLDSSSGITFWDEVAYKNSVDGGVTWSPEKKVLKPSEGEKDQLSICDPGVVKIGEYYYLAYTSTEDPRMIFNHVYVARSKFPDRGWEKWSGDRWGVNPQPIILFDGDKDAWGAGEPSMVVRNDSLFFYYTWRDKGKHEIRVALGDAKSKNWPSTLRYKGVAIDQTNINGADHGDVKYRPDINKFQLVNTASRFSKDAHLQLWESDNGIHFQKLMDFKDGIEPYLHNCGWSGDELGHQNPLKPQYLSYAYGVEWGNWKTKWHPIKYNRK